MSVNLDKDFQEISNQDFSKLIDSTFKQNSKYEKKIINGKIISIEKENVIVDVGLKSEGRIPVSEFTRPGQEPEIKIGDKIEVFLDKLDDSNGEIRLSREKAIKQSSWDNLEKSYQNSEKIIGIPFNRVKGGLSVDLNGVVAFLPGSQIDSKPIKDTKDLINKPIEMQILKMDKIRGNIVVSRKLILEEKRKKARNELMSNVKEGMTIKGVVKNLTDYGAFIDLGGMDGLVHILDITWNKINHPSDHLKIGDEIETKIIKFNKENSRLSLGIKQLTPDPWEGLEEQYKIGNKYSGTVSNITDYGAFVNLNDNLEGLIQNQDLSWTKKNIHASKILKINDNVEVELLEIDKEKRRINLGLKQCKENPWKEITNKYSVGETIESSIVNIVDFGIFVSVSNEIDGMIHISDFSWENNQEEMLSNFKKGQSVKAKILEIDEEKERVSLGIKQLSNDPFEEIKKEYKRNTQITGEILSINDNGIEVKVTETVKGFIKKSDLAKEKSEQKIDRFAVGEKIDSIVSSYDIRNKILILSIKQKEIIEEKEALNKFGSSDSGASLGDILGKVLGKKKDN